jgi:hypothetical protein
MHMNNLGKAATLAAIILVLLILFQVLLAAGLPLGRAAWGGEHRVLPTNLRVGSLVAAAIIGVAVWAVLARAGMVTPGAKARGVQMLTWIFACYFALNIVMNLASKSPPERFIMTPVSVILVVCFVMVARSDGAA